MMLMVCWRGVDIVLLVGMIDIIVAYCRNRMRGREEGRREEGRREERREEEGEEGGKEGRTEGMESTILGERGTRGE